MKKILIVDDEPMMLKIAERALKDTYETLTALTGEEALGIIDEFVPDMVLTDIKMPGISGPEILGRAREKNVQIPFIFMSAEDEDGAEKNMEELGAAGYIKKPIRSDALKELAEKVLSGAETGQSASAGSGSAISDQGKEEEKLPGWLLMEPLIDVTEGLKNSEDAETYMSSISIFLEHVNENAQELGDCIKAGDFETYTIRAHALKSTSRIIGAMVLSTMAAAMERAGKQGNTTFIINEHDEFMRLYRKYEKLFLQHVEASASEAIPENVLNDMMMALKEYAMAEDYTLTEMAVGSLLKYSLPKDVEKKVLDIKQSLFKLDWEQIRTIMGLN